MNTALVDMNTVATRCGGKRRDLLELTPVDWVVLDFANGKRSFKDLTRLLPTEQAAILNALRHLKQLGFVTWPEIETGRKRTGTANFAPMDIQSVEQNTVEYNAQTYDAELGIALADLSDDQCLKYIPRRLLTTFRAFIPKLASSKYEIDLGTQALIEFLALNINSLSPYEILGVEPDADKNSIRQAYLKRSRLFHPDRYFRKNIGVFSNHLATLFKAVTQAFSSLQ